MDGSIPFGARRGEPGYPPELLRLPDPPEQLRLRGRVPALARAVAIVGTRAASERGRHIARALAGELVHAGCVVVSGGAFGIDHAAHVGALEAGGATVVVHASGLAATYPAEHRPLYDRIVLSGGCEVSEREDHESPRPRHFLARNRVIAALSRAVVVVEAPRRSGALSTAAHARAADIPVLAVPRVPETEASAGSNELIRRGAIACMSARDVLGVVEGLLPAAPAMAARTPGPRRARGRASASRPPRAPGVEALGARARAILAAIEEGARELDDLAVATGLPLDLLLAELAELELAGLVAEARGGRFEVLG